MRARRGALEPDVKEISSVDTSDDAFSRDDDDDDDAALARRASKRAFTWHSNTTYRIVTRHSRYRDRTPTDDRDTRQKGVL